MKNYTGDVLQFGLATERMNAQQRGSDKVRQLIVGDGLFRLPSFDFLDTSWRSFSS